MYLRHIKTILIFFVLLLLFLLPALYLSGCSDSGIEAGLEDRVNVIVSIPPQEEFLEEIGGDRVKVTTMVQPGSNPHTYEPLPGQLREVSQADMYFKIGTGIDFEITWMDRIIDLNRQMKVIDCSEGIGLNSSDPHIWLSPVNAAVMVENIFSGLSEIDPENEDYYRANMESYMKELAQLDEYITGLFLENEVRIMMVVHPAWTYFACEYGLEQLAIETEGKEPTPGTLETIVEKAMKDDIKVIFASPEFDLRSAETIAGEIGADVVTASPLDKNYIDNIKKVAEVLAESSGRG